jgi:quercetin dioxygenase-like cupin family protein
MPEPSDSLLVPNLLEKISPPLEGTLSLTLHQTESVKVVLFGFAAGQELSEHTASMPAIMHQLSGEAQWRLGDEQTEAGPGTWVHMPAHLPHTVTAKTPCVMLLTLITAAKAKPRVA